MTPNPLNALRTLLPQPPAAWVNPDRSASSPFYRFILQLLTTLQGGLTILPGVVIDFAGPASNIPTGYLICDGSLQQIGTYPNLYASIGTTWGGDGVTTFALPPYVGRFKYGATEAGGIGGSSTATLTQQNLPTSQTNLTPASNVTTGSAAGGVTVGTAGVGLAFAIMPPYATYIPLIKT